MLEDRSWKLYCIFSLKLKEWNPLWLLILNGFVSYMFIYVIFIDFFWYDFCLCLPLMYTVSQSEKVFIIKK